MVSQHAKCCYCCCGPGCCCCCEVCTYAFVQVGTRKTFRIRRSTDTACPTCSTSCRQGKQRDTMGGVLSLGKPQMVLKIPAAESLSNTAT
jgi:hypothetical protein